MNLLYNCHLRISFKITLKSSLSNFLGTFQSMERQGLTNWIQMNGTHEWMNECVDEKLTVGQEVALL